MTERRKKNLAQSKKQLSSKNIKPDIWKRKGFVPHWKSVRQMHVDDYQRRMKLPEGKGTGRSLGSNKRLQKLMRW